ncbi:Beta-lactamase superfamily domain-containing protein [Nitrosomonas cryotolerans]|uniref:Beta-lactamase superfamily domain-containing protein n=1 Tax=Nitrosomonas cryotolerans ATCC 49181 TaxID=1131553 RepID=A0A1N6HMM0_9PROT|nr:3',5'-cyclic-nucleotide phosphodiesterase [Nitrosomonas cryotolerans]SFQ05673.1 Beta-lactamase superfamily domain-containing protein [Nitrosomonas cryotolerans]SIO21011.1 Beta-lactamase superfamily domain-containing protein [Nitrosomonas cryotolerans ATCC 49181]
MKLKVLGCSGGIGGRSRTTALLLDSDILIDAGTGVGDLSIAELASIDHVFVSHSHLDHVAFIPFLVDTVGSMRDQPLTVYATQPTLAILQTHLFNEAIWPDFTQIPDSEAPYLRYATIAVGETVDLGGRKITPLPANHIVPAVGFQLDSGQASLVFTGDTTSHDALWGAVNQIENLRYLIIESAFSNQNKTVAIQSRHLCPDLLMAELEKLQRPAEIYITHLKQGDAALIMREIAACAGPFQPRRLSHHQLFEF